MGTSQLVLLSQKVRQLLEAFADLQQQNRQLEEALAAARRDGADAGAVQRICDLEAEVRQLKKENKTLKEREKLIRNKTERLAVKLGEIDI